MLDAATLFLVPADEITLALAGVLVCLLAAIFWRWWRNRLITPEERERKRRNDLAAKGKMGDASVIDFREGHIFYTYDVRGVEYTASQDISAIAQLVPADLALAVGHVLVKYDPRNPANSVILSEEWSGFRAIMPHQ
jgi:hypothetical protein